MKRGLVIALTCGNDSLMFSQTSALRIMAGGLSGFDYPETDVDLVGDAFGKRSYARSISVCPRKLGIRFEVTDEALFADVRDKINRMMSPGRTLTLTTYFLGRRRTLEVIPYKAPEYVIENLSDRVQIVLSLTAPKPYFTEGILYRSSVPVSKPMLTFPLSFMRGAGAASGLAGVKNAAVIHNPGDTDCPVTLYLYTDGVVREPSVMLRDRKISFSGELAPGDRMRVDSTDGKCSITVNGSVVGSFDRRNRAFSLAPGENTVVLNAAYGAPYLRCYFEFEPRYFGM